MLLQHIGKGQFLWKINLEHKLMENAQEEQKWALGTLTIFVILLILTIIL